MVIDNCSTCRDGYSIVSRIAPGSYFLLLLLPYCPQKHITNYQSQSFTVYDGHVNKHRCYAIQFTLHCMFTILVNASRAWPKTRVLVIVTSTTILQLVYSCQDCYINSEFTLVVYRKQNLQLSTRLCTITTSFVKMKIYYIHLLLKIKCCIL